LSSAQVIPLRQRQGTQRLRADVGSPLCM